MTPEGARPASILIRDGRVARVAPHGGEPRGADVVDYGDDVVMPGIVDSHVHINEPGRSDWEGFSTATRAAAAGGVTTLIDMPLNSVPPTTSVDGLRAKREAADGRCFVDVGFWGGLVPGNLPEVSAMLELGVFGFKAFLAPSGVPEFGHVSAAELEAGLAHVADRGVPILVHAELGALLEPGNAVRPAPYRAYLESRPAVAESEAIALVARLCRETGGRAHVVHLSAADAVPVLREALEAGVRLSAETCPHYLFFSAEGIPPGATEYKCAPPIRAEENRSRLWEALEGGVIAMVVSDHSPAPPASKCRDSGDFDAAWGGIASLELSLRALWTAARERGCSLERVSEWLSGAPARMAGLEDRKGRIAPGCDADLVVWRPEESAPVDEASLHQRHKLTPYAGRLLNGAIVATWLRGEKIYEPGRAWGSPTGRLLSRTEAA